MSKEKQCWICRRTEQKVKTTLEKLSPDISSLATNKFDNAKEFFCNEIYRDIYGGDVSMKHPNWLLNDMNKDENLLRVF